ncbi:MAG: tryptophan 7-halogenase [Actinobacteria bacterium]|nr:tryptophan 7-halogenase [Actinomycetota bacterium]
MSRQRAVVAGGSIAGLFASMAAAEHFDQVIVIDRDDLEDGAKGRKGAPQGKHVHALLSAGLDAACEFVPDLRDQLTAKGCSIIDQIREVPFMSRFGWRALADSGIKTYNFRRPLFEAVVRENLGRKPHCTIRVGAVAGLLTDEARGVVTGVRLADGETVEADLVIDATGRGSQAGKWIEELGYSAPGVMQLRAFMGYATQIVQAPDANLAEGIRGMAAMPYPGHHRGGLVLEVDNGVHIVTAVGMVRDYPPADRDELLAYLDQAPSPALGALVRACEPLSDVATYRMPGSQRRLWEQLERRPGGFVVLGDAVGSFNPIYGQGMTQAAKAAVELRDCLRESEADGDLPQRFQSRLSGLTAPAFAIASTADSFYEGVELENVTIPDDPEAMKYMEALEQLATGDTEIAVAMFRAHSEMDLELLGTEGIRTKVADWIGGGRTVAPFDPNQIPKLSDFAATA